MFKKEFGRPVHDWTAGNFFTSDDSHQFSFQQRTQHTGGFHPTDFFDLRPHQRLFVGNDRQRFQSGSGQFCRRLGLIQPLDPRGIVLLRDETVPSRDHSQSHAAPFFLERLTDISQCLFHFNLRHVPHHGHKARQGQRF